MAVYAPRVMHFSAFIIIAMNHVMTLTYSCLILVSQKSAVVYTEASEDSSKSFPAESIRISPGNSLLSVPHSRFLGPSNKHASSLACLYV